MRPRTLETPGQAPGEILLSAKPINSYQVKQTNKNNIRNKSTNLLSLVRSLASLACWVFPAEALLPALQTPVPGVNQLGRCSCLGWGCRVWRRCTHLNARWQWALWAPLLGAAAPVSAPQNPANSTHSPLMRALRSSPAHGLLESVDCTVGAPTS